MRRGFTAIELMIVIAIICIIAAIAIPNLAKEANEKKPVTYALKNSVTYLVTATCGNCKKPHKIELTVGTKVRTDHACPWCGVKAVFTIDADDRR